MGMGLDLILDLIQLFNSNCVPEWEHFQCTLLIMFFLTAILLSTNLLPEYDPVTTAQPVPLSIIFPPV